MQPVRRVFSVASVLALSLLLTAVCIAPQTSFAQEPTFNSENPVRSLATAQLDSDEDRVAFATSLIEARADTEISYATYRTGVQFFKQNHPAFYGAFFGDPFYAEYDVRYQRLTSARRVANLDVDPFASLFNIGWLFCHPQSYDPAFNGRCRGFAFPVDEFSVLPSFASLSRPFKPQVGIASFQPHAHRHAPHTFHREAGGPNGDKSEDGDETKSLDDESSGINPPPTTNPPRKIDPKIEADDHARTVEANRSTTPEARSASNPEVYATTTSLKRPLEIKRLSDRDVIKLLKPLRDQLSPREKYELLTEMARTTGARSHSAGTLHDSRRSSSRHMDRSGRSDDVARLSETLRNRLSGASGSNASSVVDTDVVELKDKIVDRLSDRSSGFERSQRPHWINRPSRTSPSVDRGSVSSTIRSTSNSSSQTTSSSDRSRSTDHSDSSSRKVDSND